MFDIIQFFTNLSLYQITGIFGFFCYIIAFGSVQLGWLDGNSMTYSLSNVLAASLVAISLIESFNLASALIQGSWIIFGTIGLALRARHLWPRTRRASNTPFETEVL